MRICGLMVSELARCFITSTLKHGRRCFFCDLWDDQAHLFPIAEVERLLPDFVNSCRDKADVVIIHQDAFAGDYQDHEYALLGKIKKRKLKSSRSGELNVTMLHWSRTCHRINSPGTRPP